MIQDSATTRKRNYGNILPAVALLVGILIIYWRALFYPFIYDDWTVLRSILFENSSTYFEKAFRLAGRGSYRPLGQTYFYAAFLIFKQNPLGFHVISLLLHFVNSLLAVFIARKILGNRFLSWAVGLFYAFSVTIHLDPLLWLVGFYDLGGMLFFLLSFAAFIKRKHVLSALLFLVSILIKESTICLPLIFFFFAVYRYDETERSRHSVKNSLVQIVPHLAVLIVYLGGRLVGSAFFSLSTHHPYAMALTGGHILQHMYLYGTYFLEALLPMKERVIQPTLFFTIVITAIVLTAAMMVIMMKKKDDSSDVSLWCFCLLWMFFGIAPVLVMPNILAKYYSIHALIPFFILFVSATRRFFSMLGIPHLVGSALVIILLCGNIYTSSYYFYSKEQQGMEARNVGSFNLVQKAATASILREYLQNNYPSLPAGTTILIDWIDRKATGGSAALQVWYNDSTLNLFNAGDVGIVDNRIYLLRGNDGIDQDQALLPIGGAGSVLLNPDKIKVFVFYEGKITPSDLSILKRL